MWYEDLAKELLGIQGGGARQFVVLCAQRYVQGQALVLLELDRGHKARTPGELAETLNLTSGRIANILKSLQRGGYVRREKDAADGRRVHVMLTEQGKAKAQDLYNGQVEICGKMLCGLGEQDAREFVRILKKFPSLHI